MANKNKTALLTGATGGIGKAVMQRLLQDGFQIFLIARPSQCLSELVKPYGASVVEIHCDLSKPKERRDVFLGIQESLGSHAPNLIVHAAGVWHDKKSLHHGLPLHKIPNKRIDACFEVGVKTLLDLVKTFSPAMIERRDGALVAVSCLFKSTTEAKGWVHYYLTNKAIESAVTGIAAELMDSGVRINCVAPRYVATEALKKFLPEEAPGALTPEEVADRIIDLCTAQCTGTVVKLDSN